MIQFAPNMWRFNTSQDWEVLRDNFHSVNLDTILNGTLQGLGFYFSLVDYLKKGALWFVNIMNNLDLTMKPVENGQLITNSKDG